MELTVTGNNLTNGLLDNPCLSRMKDGLALTADFANSQCYAQKAITDIRKLYSYKRRYSGWIGQGVDMGAYRGYRESTRCRHVSNTFGVTGYTGVNGTLSHDNGMVTHFDCLLYSTTYHSDFGWNKLNNSTQEWRESF